MEVFNTPTLLGNPILQETPRRIVPAQLYVARLLAPFFAQRERSLRDRVF